MIVSENKTMLRKNISSKHLKEHFDDVCNSQHQDKTVVQSKINVKSKEEIDVPREMPNSLNKYGLTHFVSLTYVYLHVIK